MEKIIYVPVNSNGLTTMQLCDQLANLRNKHNEIVNDLKDQISFLQEANGNLYQELEKLRMENLTLKYGEQGARRYKGCLD